MESDIGINGIIDGFRSKAYINTTSQIFKVYFRKKIKRVKTIGWTNNEQLYYDGLSTLYFTPVYEGEP